MFDTLAALVKEVGASEKLQNCPVRFIPGILEKYASGQVSLEEARKELRDTTKREQFIFGHFPKEEIKENQRIFKNEFVFANEISYALSIMKPAVLDADEVNQKIHDSLVKYLKTLERAGE